MNLKDMIPWKRKTELAKGAEESPFDALQRDMNRLFDEFTRDWFMEPFSRRLIERSEYIPSIDISEDENEVRVTAELPGMDENDIEVSLSGDALIIRGEKKNEREDKKKGYYRMERSYGSFQRAIQLPQGLDTDKTKASFSKGVLTIQLPKTPEAKKKFKRIPLS